MSNTQLKSFTSRFFEADAFPTVIGVCTFVGLCIAGLIFALCGSASLGSQATVPGFVAARTPTESEVQTLVTQYIEAHQGRQDAAFHISVISVTPKDSSGFVAGGSIGAANGSGTLAGGFWVVDLTPSGSSFTVSNLSFKDEVSNVNP